jgi:plastocyanin
MKRNYFLGRIGFVFLLGAGIIAGCTKESLQEGTISSQGVSDTTNTIGISGNSYSRPDHWVGKNFPITWVNRDSRTHSVTADNGSWTSGPMQPGTSYTRAFSEVGSYSYHDDFSTARGTINVFGRDE